MDNYTSERPKPDHVFEERQMANRLHDEFVENRERYNEWDYRRKWFYPVWHHDDLAEYSFNWISNVGPTGPIYPENIVRVWRRTRENNYMLFWEIIPGRIP